MSRHHLCMSALMLAATAAATGAAATMCTSEDAQESCEGAGPPPRAFVVGASGATGRAVVAQLAERGWEVTALVRKEKAKQDLFPEITEEAEGRVMLAVEPDVEEWSKQTPLRGLDPASVDAVFLCSGTSRQNPEVKAAMEARGGEGFAEWLRRIDVELPKRVATYAYAHGVRVVARVSAVNADPDVDPASMNGFGNYFKHQGLSDRALSQAPEVTGAAATLLLFRPGALYRGEDLRTQRAWEMTARHTEGLDVRDLARVMIGQVEHHLNDAAAAKGVHIYTKDDIDDLKA